MKEIVARILKEEEDTRNAVLNGRQEADRMLAEAREKARQELEKADAEAEAVAEKEKARAKNDFLAERRKILDASRKEIADKKAQRQKDIPGIAGSIIARIFSVESADS